jgi:hypothetical protein
MAVAELAVMRKQMPWMKFTPRMDVESVLARCTICNCEPYEIGYFDDPKHTLSTIMKVHSSCAAKWYENDPRGWRRHSMAKMLTPPASPQTLEVERFIKARAGKAGNDIVRPKRAIELEDK